MAVPAYIVDLYEGAISCQNDLSAARKHGGCGLLHRLVWQPPGVAPDTIYGEGDLQDFRLMWTMQGLVALPGCVCGLGGGGGALFEGAHGL